MSLLDHHLGFIGALRDAGIPVSASETLDALAALQALPELDRDPLRAAYSATTVKRSTHQEAFNVLFDIWFPTAIGHGSAGPMEERNSTLPPSLDPEVQEFRERVLEELLENDPAGRRALAREAVGRFGRTPDQTWSARRVEDVLLPGTLLVPLLSRSGIERGGTAEQVARTRFRGRIESFEGDIEDEVRRRANEERGEHRTAADFRAPLEELDFTAIKRSDLAELRREVQRLSRKLAVRLALRQRRKRRGRLDMRRTMRASLSTGGVPADLHRLPPRKSRPDLVVICDVSDSMLAFTRFALLFTFALQERFSRVRAFAFIDSTDEITEYFAGGQDVDAATRAVVREARIVEASGNSNYGHAFMRFRERFPDAITPKSTLLILGDARVNYFDEGIPTLRHMVSDARRAYWLNPEAHQLWGSGDSAAHQYEQHIEMVECRNLVQLSAFIEHIA